MIHNSWKRNPEQRQGQQRCGSRSNYILSCCFQTLTLFWFFETRYHCESRLALNSQQSSCHSLPRARSTTVPNKNLKLYIWLPHGTHKKVSKTFYFTKNKHQTSIKPMRNHISTSAQQFLYLVRHYMSPNNISGFLMGTVISRLQSVTSSRSQMCQVHTVHTRPCISQKITLCTDSVML